MYGIINEDELKKFKKTMEEVEEVLPKLVLYGHKEEPQAGTLGNGHVEWSDYIGKQVLIAGRTNIIQLTTVEKVSDHGECVKFSGSNWMRANSIRLVDTVTEEKK